MIDELDFIKMKDFCAKNNTLKKVKRQPTEQDNIFSNHVSNKARIARIYKEPQQCKE